MTESLSCDPAKLVRTAAPLPVPQPYPAGSGAGVGSTRGARRAEEDAEVSGSREASGSAPTPVQYSAHVRRADLLWRRKRRRARALRALLFAHVQGLPRAHRGRREGVGNLRCNMGVVGEIAWELGVERSSDGKGP